MKLVYMGTPDFAVNPLEALVEAGYPVEAVITQPDKPKGRGKTLLPTPVKEEAQKTWDNGISAGKGKRSGVYKNTGGDRAGSDHRGGLSDRSFPKQCWTCPDTAVSISTPLCFPNTGERHPFSMRSLMEKKNPTQRSTVDTGDMIAKVSVPLDKEETGGSLFDKLSKAGAELLVRTLPSIFDGTAVYEKQPAESPTPYASMITKEMGRMDFHKDAEQLERLVRGLDPWPSAYTYLDGKVLKVWKSEVSREETAAEPGTVIRTDRKGIYVSCGKEVLILTELQLAGKKRMSADAFLRGYAVREGMLLG